MPTTRFAEAAAAPQTEAASARGEGKAPVDHRLYRALTCKNAWCCRRPHIGFSGHILKTNLSASRGKRGFRSLRGKHT